MARGFLSGIIWGGVVSVVGAGAVSVVTQERNAPRAEVTAPRSSEAPEAGENVTTEAATDADLVLDDTAPQVPRPAADDVAAATQAGADTPQVPQAGAAENLEDPGETADAGALTLQDQTTVAAADPAPQPTAPRAETELSISTEPAQPAAPDVPETPTAFADDAGALSTGASPEVPAAEAPAPDTPAVADAPAPADTDAPAQTSEAPPAPPVAPEVEPAPEAEAEAEPESEPERAEERQIAALPSADDPTPNTGPTIGTPGVSLVDRTPEVPGTQAPEAEAPSDPRAVIANAVPFENPEAKPLMSIVLMDSGVDLTGGPVGLAALQSFPYPLTFAVDATLADAGERMADYRSQGFEVAALMDLPTGATASDAEVALSAALAAVPEAVAVMEGVTTGLQDSREASEQIARAVRDTGHGLVLQSKGLNTTQKLAVRDGVPAGLIFRDFDSADQTPSTIRRFLDQAAFRAGQEGGVIMVGRVRPDTISALLLWGLQDRAQRVALAPVSAVLTALVAPQ